jgi:hypothetical protein
VRLATRPTRRSGESSTLAPFSNLSRGRRRLELQSPQTRAWWPRLRIRLRQDLCIRLRWRRSRGRAAVKEAARRQGRGPVLAGEGRSRGSGGPSRRRQGGSEEGRGSVRAVRLCEGESERCVGHVVCLPDRFFLSQGRVPHNVVLLSTRSIYEAIENITGHRYASSVRMAR